MNDQPLHMWSHKVPPPVGMARSHGTCGVHIGRFTSDPDKVTCTNCLAVINAKKGSDEPAEPVSQ